MTFRSFDTCTRTEPILQMKKKSELWHSKVVIRVSVWSRFLKLNTFKNLSSLQLFEHVYENGADFWNLTKTKKLWSSQKPYFCNADRTLKISWKSVASNSTHPQSFKWIYTLDVLLSQVPLTRIYLAFIVIGARFVRGPALKSDTSAWTRRPQRNTFR